MRRIGCLALVILPLVVLAILDLIPRFKRVEKRSDSVTASVSEVVPMNEEATAGVIVGVFMDRNLRPGGKFNLFGIASAAEQIFPDEFQLRAVAGNDAALQKYVAIDPGLRKKDLYLYEATGDYYWNSEYFYNGGPAEFRCGFIVHLEPQADSQTRLEIFEYVPTVRVGKAFHLLGHAGPDFYYDIRNVAPTNSDRVELLEVLKQKLRTPQ